MSALRTIGPASIEVWISSPVRSRNPVLMNTTRDLAARMHSARLTVVRRSSSMMPTLTVFAGRPSSPLDRGEQVVGERDLVGAVHLRLDDVDRAGRRVALPSAGRARSCMAASADTIASRMPSGHLRGRRASSTAGVVIRWPTLRTSSSDRPRFATTRAVDSACTCGRRRGGA